VFVASCVLFAARPALAAGPADAAGLAKEAKSLLAKGQLEAACDTYAESVKLDRKAQVALDLAACREKQGRPALAYRALDVAAESALREKSAFAEKTARAKQKALEKSLALLTVRPRDGVSIALDGAAFDEAARSAPWALDPGEHTLEGTAEGKKPWSLKLALKAGQRETVEVPALEELPKAVAAPVTTVATEEARDVVETGPSEGKAGRLVLEVGFLGGLARGALDALPSSSLDGLPYSVPGTNGGSLVAACADTKTVPGAGECTASFNPHTGAMLGAQVFAGWSLAARLHAGLRAFGGTVSPGGFVVAAGPAVSLRVVGPVWVGVGGVLGYEQQRAVLTGARGSVPPESRAAAGGADVNVPLGSKLGATIDIDSGLVGGGTLELAVSVLGVSNPGVVGAGAPVGALSGSLLVGVWPSVLAGSHGMVFTMPAGVSYRFH